MSFSTANGNAITVADIDGGTLTTTLTVTNGILALGSTAGVLVCRATAQATWVITGTAAAINAALNGTSFTNTADFNGSANLTVSTTDGALTDIDAVAITITPCGGHRSRHRHHPRGQRGDLLTGWPTTASRTPAG